MDGLGWDRMGGLLWGVVLCIFFTVVIRFVWCSVFWVRRCFFGSCMIL